MYVALLGPPGAGKGTQAKMLAERMNLSYIATGDLFRQHQQKSTPLGLKARVYIERGELVPDEITTAMVEEHLASLDHAKGLILDGYPRTLAQAKDLEQILSTAGKKLDRVLSLIIPEEELVRRLSGRLICRSCQTPYHIDSSPPRVPGRCDACGGTLYQREDDFPEVVRQRIRVYHEQTEPLIQYYRNKGNLTEVDGTGDIVEVNRRLKKALKVEPASQRDRIVVECMNE